MKPRFPMNASFAIIKKPDKTVTDSKNKTRNKLIQLTKPHKVISKKYYKAVKG